MVPVRYVARRLVWAVFTMWAISVVSFVIIQLPPGDFATTYVNRLAQAGASPGDIAHARQQLGLDKSGFQQYLSWMGRLLHGDLGQSLSLNRPVADVLQGDLAYTGVLVGAALIVSWCIALPIGVYSAVHRYSPLDHVMTFLGFLGLAVPSFLLALILMYFSFDWFGISIDGLFSPQYETAPWGFGKVFNMFEHLIVPAIVLGAAGMAHLMRIMRANLLDELGKPYVVTAQAKGLPKWRVIRKYPVRVALNPFASSIGLLVPQVVSASIIVSVVLGLPTLGPRLLDALKAQDMFLAGAIVLFLGLLTVVGTLISDIVLMVLDPRIRHAG
ncbi:MAG TPA: ABC transporter permease [Jatrophihabitans sp.]|nr:ABC transporter permease [Jatrophihabitans sp.]